MRVSTNIQFDSGLRAMNKQQSEINRLSQQISGERRVLTPADDPIAAAREVTLETGRLASVQMLRNQDDVRGQLKNVETALDSASDILSAFRTKLGAANNGALSVSDRETYAKELETMRDQLYGVANQQDENGNYRFSGFKAGTQAFVRNGDGTIAYNGDTGVREVQVGATRTMASNMTGNYLFMDVPTGKSGLTATANPANTGTGYMSSSTISNNVQWKADSANGPFTVTFGADGAYEVFDNATPTPNSVGTGTLSPKGGGITAAGVTLNMSGMPAPGDSFEFGKSQSQDIFATMQAAIDALRLPDDNNGTVQRNNAVREAQVDLDSGIDRVLEATTVVGARQKELDSLTDQDTLVRDNTAEEITRLVGMGPDELVAAISEMSQRTVSLTAAQKVYSQVAGMSLFNYI
jgi:flagellar hook-associated protein 3 FlgL